MPRSFNKKLLGKFVLFLITRVLKDLCTEISETSKQMTSQKNLFNGNPFPCFNLFFFYLNQITKVASRICDHSVTFPNASHVTPRHPRRVFVSVSTKTTNLPACNTDIYVSVATRSVAMVAYRTTIVTASAKAMVAGNAAVIITTLSIQPVSF